MERRDWEWYWRGRRIQVPGSNSEGRVEWWFKGMGDIMVDANGVLRMVQYILKQICSWQRRMEEYGS